MSHNRLCLLFSFFLLFGWVQAQEDETSLDTLAVDSLSLDTLTVLDTVNVDSLREVLIQEAIEADPEEESVPEGFGLGTPRETMYTLLEFQQEKSFFPELAGLTFNQSEVTTEESVVLASQLIEYLDGTGNYISYEEIPNDSNFADSLGIHKYFPIPGQSAVYMIKTGDKWIFSAKTVRELPKLHRRVYPFGKVSNRVPDWGHGKLGPLQIWQWLGIAIFLILTYVFYKLFTKILSLILGKLLTRWIPRDRAKEIFDKVSRPLSLFLMAWLLRLFIPILEFPPQTNQWISTILKVVIPIFSVVIFYNLVDLFAAYFARRAEKTDTTMDDQLVPLLRKLAKGFVIILGLLLILDNFHFNISAMLAGLSIGGIAIALAAQDTVKNFFGSIMIFLDRPFQVGDWIIANGQEGVVEEVGVRSTRIRSFANSVIYIPNGSLADASINNFGLRTYRRFSTKIGLTYDTPPAKIEAFVEGLRAIVKNHPSTRKDYYEVNFTEMGDSSLNILLYTFFEVPTWTDELKGKQNLLLAIMRLAETLGVSFAFPTQTLHIENAPGAGTLTPEHPGTKAEFDKKVADFITDWKVRMENKEGTGGDTTKAWAGGEG